MPSPRGTIYLLHFHVPFHHARHYMGWTEDLSTRLADHVSFRGSALMAALTRAKRGWTLARTWVGVTRHHERKLKDSHNNPRLCPICSNPSHARSPA